MVLNNSHNMSYDDNDNTIRYHIDETGKDGTWARVQAARC